MSTGTVESFDAQRGYGWIRDDADPDGRQLFLHFADIEMDGFKIRYAGDAVVFDRVMSPKGPRAKNVRTLQFELGGWCEKDRVPTRSPAFADGLQWVAGDLQWGKPTRRHEWKTMN